MFAPLRTSWPIEILGARVALCFYKIMTSVTCLHVHLLVEFLNGQFTNGRKYYFFHGVFDSLFQKVSQNIYGYSSITVSILFSRDEILVSADNRIWVMWKRSFYPVF